MKKPLVSLLSLALAFTVVSPSLSAEGSAESQATVEFTAPTEPVAPVNPEDPTQPNPDAGDAGNITGQEGPLSLDYVSHLDFGNQIISTSQEVYEATTDLPYIQVSDLRGTGEGWEVIAQVSHFNNEGIDSLPGSSIQLNNGNAVSTSTTDGPVINPSINLVTGRDPVNVVTAAPKEDGSTVSTAQGLGTWVMRWLGESEGTNEKVTLTVPGSTASVGNHTATITWTLNAGSPDGTED